MCLRRSSCVQPSRQPAHRVRYPHSYLITFPCMPLSDLNRGCRFWSAVACMRRSRARLDATPRLQVFPHHENEIAQSQAAACQCGDKDHLVDGRDFVRFWLHNGFVNIDSEKMCDASYASCISTQCNLQGWAAWVSACGVSSSMWRCLYGPSAGRVQVQIRGKLFHDKGRVEVMPRHGAAVVPHQHAVSPASQLH